MTILTMQYPSRTYIRSAQDIPVEEAARECARRAYGAGAEPEEQLLQLSKPGQTIYTYRCTRPSPVTPSLRMYIGDVSFDLVK